MDLPIEITSRIDDLLSHHKLSGLKSISNSISERYLKSYNKEIINTDEALVYACMRMPATYSSLYNVISNALLDTNFSISSILDLGSGVGSTYIVLKQILCSFSYLGIEKQDSMISVMKEIVGDLDIIKEDFIVSNLPNADLVVASYSLNEIDKNKLDEVVKKIFEKANKLLIIVEPGTIDGFNEIKYIRELLIREGGYIVSPCPHQNACDSSWCHFSTRVARNKTHRYLKDGDAAYEDEKYSYLVISKTKIDQPKYYRILRHPIINKGYIDLSICMDNKIETKRFTKKDNIYHNVKKLSWGDKYIIK